MFQNISCGHCDLGACARVIRQIEFSMKSDSGAKIFHPFALVYCSDCRKYSLWATAPPRLNNSIDRIVYTAQLSPKLSESLLKKALELKARTAKNKLIITSDMIA